MKRFFSVFALSILIVSLFTAAAPIPNTTFRLVQGLPEVMQVGETYTVIVEVESDQPFLFAQALPSFQYVGKGVVAVQGGDHGTWSDTLPTTLEVTFEAKSPTAALDPSGVPVHVVAGARYPGGGVVVQDFLFKVIVVE